MTAVTPGAAARRADRAAAAAGGDPPRRGPGPRRADGGHQRPHGTGDEPLLGLRGPILAPRAIPYLLAGLAIGALFLANDRGLLTMSNLKLGGASDLRGTVMKAPVTKYVGYVLAALLVLVYPLFVSNFWQGVAVEQIAIYVLLALGLNVVVGLAGLLDLGYIAFFAIGAYTTAYFTGSLPVQPPVRAQPVLRHPARDPHLDARGCHPRRADAAAARRLPRHRHPRVRRDRPHPRRQRRQHRGHEHHRRPARRRAAVAVDRRRPGRVHVGPGLAALLLPRRRLHRRSWSSASSGSRRAGSAASWTAIREDEVAAAASGVPTVRYKLLAFAIGASTSGLAGVLYASKVGFFAPDNFLLVASLLVLTMVIFGGMGSIPGVIVGAASCSGCRTCCATTSTRPTASSTSGPSSS